jgi:hypothetical protein
MLGGMDESLHLAAPTPCPGWDVRAELNHLAGGMRIFAAELTGPVAP